MSRLTENDVVIAVANHLRSEGWAVRQALTTTQQGVDIVVTNAGRTLHVEAKGGTSSKEGTARHGKPFSRGQVFDHVAKAVLTAMAVVSKGGGVEAAIALPDEANHREFVSRVAPALASLSITVFFVAEDGSVMETADGR